MPKNFKKDLTFSRFSAWIWGKSPAETETKVPIFIFTALFIHQKAFFCFRITPKFNYHSARNSSI